LGPENLETQMSQSGLPLVGVAIVPLPGANYLDISKEFYKKFEALKKDLPKDINLNIAIDNTVFVKKSVLKLQKL
jgi:multidrug efflux pump